MNSIIERKLIFLSDELESNDMLLKCISNLQYEHIYIEAIIKSKFNNNFIEKLIKIISYILQLNCVYNMIIYTNDKNIFKYNKEAINQYGIPKERFVIKPIMLYENINDRQITNLESFDNIFVIKDNTKIEYYDPKIFIPILTI